MRERNGAEERKKKRKKEASQMEAKKAKCVF